ncbi:MAG: alkaline phosphatase family protein [Pirellulales bacterium]|nr:alkaline phosphatase family protein [Pirellulales bacterium]
MEVAEQPTLKQILQQVSVLNARLCCAALTVAALIGCSERPQSGTAAVSNSTSNKGSIHQAHAASNLPAIRTVSPDESTDGGGLPELQYSASNSPSIHRAADNVSDVSSSAHGNPLHSSSPEVPTLVVVVSVDQWAYEYFERFRKNLAPNGVTKRTQRSGIWHRNCLHQHAFTYTGPGHSVLLTGAYPNRNGIIGNSWFDRETGESRYCVADQEATLVGDTRDSKVSPKQLLVETVGNQLKLATQGKSKIFTVAIKDRAAILMAGHTADAAIWMANAGPWITTDYYRNDVPGYLRQIDYKRYAGAEWTLLLPPEEYQHGAMEDSTAEKPGYGMTRDFPHVLAAEDNRYYVNQLACSPFGNEITLDAARQIITYEQLGEDEYPDILGINLSSNDYVGHAFGPESLEVEDMTYRTDIALGEFADFLNESLGGQSWVMFVTADHGVAPVPERAAARGLDAKRGALGKSDSNDNIPGLRDPLEAYLRGQLNIDVGDEQHLVQAVTENAVYLYRDDHPALVGNGFVLVCDLTRDWLLQRDPIVAAVTRGDLLREAPVSANSSDTELTTLFRHAFHPHRSGDVLFAQKPYYFQGSATSTHGSPWLYDRHIPLMVLGNVHQADVEETVSPAAIAPTIARLLHIPAPAASQVGALPEVIERRIEER